MSLFFLWSWILTIVGSTAIWLIGSGHPIGWVIGVLDECLWLIYSFQTKQWGFIPASIIYIVIFSRNWIKSKNIADA